MEDFIFQSGYLGLFIVSFLAATLIPLGSEIFVITMLVMGYSPFYIFVIATMGNTLGSIVNYYVGQCGAKIILSRYIEVSPEKRQKIETTFQKWGSPILFFAWVPIVGDSLTVVAGSLNLNKYIFICWVVLGKAFRYIIMIIWSSQVFQ